MSIESNNILPMDGEAFYLPSFFDKLESDSYFSFLKSNINWQQRSIKIFGKMIIEPRQTAFYGDAGKSYKYSGLNLNPEMWNETLIIIRNRITECADIKITSVLLNYYRNGKDSMGWHRDNEPELGLEPMIASISLGANRKFYFRHRLKKKEKVSIILEHGSLLLMKGKTQHLWEHSIPKSLKEQGERINLTFRRIV